MTKPFFFKTTLSFWEYRPALLIGFSLFLGIYSALHSFSSLFFPFLSFFLSFLFAFNIERKKKIIFLLSSLFLILSSHFFVHLHYHFPQPNEEGVRGKATIEIKKIDTVNHHFGSSRLFRGEIQSFIPLESENKKDYGKNLPFSAYLPLTKERPSADKIYEVEALLKKRSDRHNYLLKVSKKTKWHPLKKSWNLAEWRFKTKKKIKKFISQKISSPRSREFLSGLSIGQFSDQELLFSFNRLGLQHIMAISGFHFSLITALLHLFFRSFVTARIASSLLITSLSGYFIFLGCSPSILRAWISCMVILVATLFEKKGDALNGLGVALTLSLLFDPLLCDQLGFQFSFITTATILLFYNSIEKAVKNIYPSYPLSNLIDKQHYRQYFYLATALLRKSLALLLTIHLTTIPLTIFLFHKFPLMSLIYNLFFPFLASLSLALFLFSLFLFPFSSFFSDLFFRLTAYYTNSILGIILTAPLSLDYTIRLEEIDPNLLVAYLSLLFLAGVFIKAKFEATNLEEFSKLQWI